jgi:UDP-2,3-diacylglucosamine pyrophosphatase LpxH
MTASLHRYGRSIILAFLGASIHDNTFLYLRKENNILTKTMFVISDLHLGGAPAEKGRPSFQMCSENGRARLAEFIRYVAKQKKTNRDIQLVLNGDIVDFLAEKNFSSFTGNNVQATKKFEQILATTKEIWSSLHQLVKAGCQLTLLLGNHDIELSLPGPRRLLMDTLGQGRVEFVYDNQGYAEGPVLIEHGNRYDGWNVISHDVLRQIRSAMSRKEKPVGYPGPAGSQMVHQIMNPLKKKYPFVDLLKPENAGVLPLLGVINPSAVKKMPQLAALAHQSSQVKFDENGIPTDVQNIAATGPDRKRDDKLLKLTRDLAGMGDPADIGFSEVTEDFLSRLGEAVTKTKRKVQINLLYRAFKAYAETHRQAFRVTHEDNEYLKPAKSAAKRGFRVIVFGHTHLVKRVLLNPTDKGVVYLNSGTWADIIKVPESILSGNKAEAMQELDKFATDMEAGQLEGWRTQLPTFVKIHLDAGGQPKADVFMYNGGNQCQRVPDK